MNFINSKLSDMDAVVELIINVSRIDILPSLNSQGQEAFYKNVVSDTKSVLESDDFTCIKIEDSGCIIGFGAISKAGYITQLFIKKEHQRKGLGTQLLSKLISTSDKYLIALKSSVNAQQFYQSNGFVATSSEEELSGIRFIPMSMEIKR
ncbi:GNAT family N-acetyltransferase [Vibrio sp. S4M6]|uniref:GNAT family N-acetyltransferase n=1 Tax=Vibrio sinus TaxID=2946865 RepID=UPI002029EA82|nr:GNAT family N-acetyltransferase [Vibrio sinus]MCL9782214.1 GNAT family N-acetyltransferase [Vibrio sinus]